MRNLKGTEDKTEILKENVESYKEGLRIAQELFKKGQITSDEAIKSQLLLTGAETSYINALIDYQLTLAKLEQAIGTPKSDFNP